MSGLSEYLTALNTKRGWSTRDIEREAHRHGHRISYASASRYLAGKHPENPTPETLQAWADIYSVDVNEVRAAAGRPGVGEPFDLGPEASRLTGPQREAIRTLARLFVEQNDALANRPEPHGTTTRPDDWTLAAMSGTSHMDRLDADADARGEESQDPGHDNPA